LCDFNRILKERRVRKVGKHIPNTSTFTKPHPCKEDPSGQKHVDLQHWGEKGEPAGKTRDVASEFSNPGLVS
jgi:hypothetical protein